MSHTKHEPVNVLHFNSICSSLLWNFDMAIGLRVATFVPFDRELGENMADDELRAMIDEFDHDGDGEST